MNLDWIKAIQLPAKITGAIFIACAVVWYLDGTAVLDLTQIGSAARPLVVVIGIVSGCLFAASIIAEVGSFVYRMKNKRAEQRAAEAKILAKQSELKCKRDKVIAHLDQLSEQETHVVATALKENSPSFTYYYASAGAGHLVAKGLLYHSGIPGVLYMDDHPFTFHDFAWDAIKQRRDALLAKEAEYEKARQAKDRR